MPFSLADLWLAIVAFFLLQYVATDGFALGAGVFSLFCSEEQRGTIMETLGVVWHGNQTWLVILGGMLFGAFPVFYSVLLSSLYLPLVLMLVGFAFRGVSFEFRQGSDRPAVWSMAFSLGSLVAAVSQGLALGGLLGGLKPMRGGEPDFVWGWISPFSLLVTLAVVFGYLMLGANYLVGKTEGRLRERGYVAARLCARVTAFLSLCVHGWTARIHPSVMSKWEDPSTAIVLAVPLLYAAAAYVAYEVLLARRRASLLLPCNVLIIFLSFASLSLALYPEMIPGMGPLPLTVTRAAASSGTLSLMLAVTAILLPVILFYRAYTYRVFQGAGPTGGEEPGRGEG